jgi:hypothetical protein
MRAILQDMQSGRLQLAEVPPPTHGAGELLVRVSRSVISLRTERAIISLAKKGPIGGQGEGPCGGGSRVPRSRRDRRPDAHPLRGSPCGDPGHFPGPESLSQGMPIVFRSPVSADDAR